MKKSTFVSTLPFISLAGAVLYLLVQIALGTAPIDDGDGLQHFSIARASFQDPSYFLDHWGKPLFSLLSAPFAQFGFKAFTLFNVLVFLITQLFAFQLFKMAKLPVSWIILVPWLFIVIPDYSYCIVGGLTEPLFGLLLTIMLWAALRKKWWIFALVASFTPFARSEGMMVVILALIYLVLLKQWKFIPFLGLGFVVYAIIGWIALQDVLWYFHNDPYPITSPYGHGNWFDYLASFKNHFGILNAIFFPFIVFGLLVWRQYDKYFRTITIALFSLIYFGIIAIHSYYWTFGLRGSAGLTRIALQGLPAFLTLAYLGIGMIWKELHKLTLVPATGVLILVVWMKLNDLTLPNKANPFQETCSEVSHYLEHTAITGKVYYLHPLIPYYLGLGSKDKHEQYIQHFHILKHIDQQGLKSGDVIVRDSKFGAVEFGMPLDQIKNYPELVPVQYFFVNDKTSEINGERKCVILYEVIPVEQQVGLPKTKWVEHPTHFPVTNLVAKKGTEYLNIDTSYLVPKVAGAEHVLKLNVEWTGKEPLILYFDNGKGLMLANELKLGQKEISLTFPDMDTQGKLFFHNPSKLNASVNIKSASWISFQNIGYQQLKTPKK